ncbi:hypothetical protein, partial [Paenibacillus chitinolyticus]|uniref:hypothetical protein n=1 Tax=Paenibacillus chitinolyticus TaxID=79263 RepID=UPI001C46B694
TLSKDTSKDPNASSKARRLESHFKPSAAASLLWLSADSHSGVIGISHPSQPCRTFSYKVKNF